MPGPTGSFRTTFKPLASYYISAVGICSVQSVLFSIQSYEGFGIIILEQVWKVMIFGKNLFNYVEFSLIVTFAVSLCPKINRKTLFSLPTYIHKSQ